MFEAIVVGTDGSDTASEAVRVAVELAPRRGALHTVPPAATSDSLQAAGRPKRDRFLRV